MYFYFFLFATVISKKSNKYLREEIVKPSSHCPDFQAWYSCAVNTQGVLKVALPKLYFLCKKILLYLQLTCVEGYDEEITEIVQIVVHHVQYTFKIFSKLLNERSARTLLRKWVGVLCCCQTTLSRAFVQLVQFIILAFHPPGYSKKMFCFSVNFIFILRWFEGANWLHTSDTTADRNKS
jgi:hypothetical protein